MSRSTATTGRERHDRLTSFARPSIREVGGDERVVEHGLQRILDIRWCVRRVEVTAPRIGRRRAALQTGRDVRDVVVGIGVFVTSEGGVYRVDRLVGNVEDGNDDAAALELAADGGVDGVYHRGVVAAGPAAVGDALDLRILCAVGDEENIRQRVVRGG